MNVLAIAAHPDDLEILAAGTLALYARAGDQVTMCVLTNGELGSDIHTRQEIARIRRAEAEASAKIIGAQFHCLDQPDGFLYDTPTLRHDLIEVMRLSSPDILVTHALEDYHPDHRATSQIVLNCRQLGTCGLIETPTAPTASIPTVLYMDTLTGIDFHPEVTIDITEVIDTKRTMLQQHVSQNNWLLRLHGVDYLDYLNTQGALRGLQIGAQYAEAFRIAHVYPEHRDFAALLPTPTVRSCPPGPAAPPANTQVGTSTGMESAVRHAR